ncbi:MAG TPA: hypothetical protein VFA72_18800 [Burkholderiales bacterium]|nr:hypothetical protein [Burkholderiales bacterium]
MPIFRAGVRRARSVLDWLPYAVIDPGLVRDTKKALNRTYEIQGMRAALDTALDIDAKGGNSSA